LARVVLVLVALALVAAHAATAGSVFVGAAADDPRSLDPVVAKAKMDLAGQAGLGAIRMTMIWTPGEDRVGGDDEIALQNAVAAANRDGIRLILSIYPRDRRTTPLTARARGEVAGYAASIAREFPSIRDFVIGNEPNLNLFWMPQFGAGGVDLAARSYELLLARVYDALKSVSPDVNVIGGALSPRGQDKAGALRQTHSPTQFIRDLGAAYRASGRSRPIMDTFAIHPYLIPSTLPPTFAHPRTTTIGIADYPKLVQLLKNAFRGTAQYGETLPILYDEFGYQSQIPRSMRRVYTHLGSAAAKDAIPEAQQARYYRQAFALAACQPTVAGLLIFHLEDERDANAWQSGLYYANGTPKTSLAPVRDAALVAREGTLAHCAKAKTTVPATGVVFHEPAASTGALTVDFTCDLPCTYTLRVVDSATGTTAAEVTDTVAGQTSVTPSAELEPGDYQYALRVQKAGRPGTAQLWTSEPFTIGAQDAGPVPLLPTLLPTAPG
jgi:hypothetical protein